MDIIKSTDMLKKQVVQLSKEGLYLKRWSGVRIASRKLNIAASQIIDCCKFKRRSAGGYYWSYHEIVYIDSNYGPLPQPEDYFDFKDCEVFEFGVNGTLFNRFKNLKIAALESNTPTELIHNACLHNHILKGCKWSYYEDGKSRGIPLKWDIKNPLTKSFILNLPENVGNHSKGVRQLSLKGEFIHSFPSIRQAAKELNLDSNSISLCCNGKRKTCGGYIFHFDIIDSKYYKKPEEILQSRELTKEELRKEIDKDKKELCIKII